jgi:hypothetical protein
MVDLARIIAIIAVPATGMVEVAAAGWEVVDVMVAIMALHILVAVVAVVQAL